MGVWKVEDTGTLNALGKMDFSFSDLQNELDGGNSLGDRHPR